MKKIHPMYFLIMVVLLIACAKLVSTAQETKRQEELAQRLGVAIEDYPYADSFPGGYFYTVLRSGMSKDQVHSIVVEYEVVYTCSKWRELYYYYSVDDNDAFRFMILYDNQGNFFRMEGEDDDSSTLSKDGCTLGLSE